MVAIPNYGKSIFIISSVLANYFLKIRDMAGLMQALLGTTLAVGVALVAGSAFAAGLPITKAVAMPASAASGNYVSVFGGVAFGASVSGNYAASGDHFSFPLDQGSVFGAALGTHLTHNLRGEVEVLYARHATTGISTYVDGAGKIYTSQLAGNLRLCGQSA
jgi:hypothetical protein